MDSIKETIAAMAKAARQASQAMTRVTSGQKNQALQAMADEIVRQADAVGLKIKRTCRPPGARDWRPP